MESSTEDPAWRRRFTRKNAGDETRHNLRNSLLTTAGWAGII